MVKFTCKISLKMGYPVLEFGVKRSQSLHSLAHWVPKTMTLNTDSNTWSLLRCRYLGYSHYLHTWNLEDGSQESVKLFMKFLCTLPLETLDQIKVILPSYGGFPMFLLLVETVMANSNKRRNSIAESNYTLFKFKFTLKNSQVY